MERLAKKLSACVVAFVVLSVGASGVDARSSASAIVGSPVRFTVVRVPTMVTNRNLSIPGGMRDSAFSPAQSDLTYCNWFDGIPRKPVVPRSSPYYPATRCTPIIPGRSFGLLQSPKNGHFEYEVLRLARPVPATHAVSVGPVLVTFGDGAGGRPSAAEADGWIWVYVPQRRHAEVLRFASATGALVQRFPIPSMDEPIMSANQEGLFLGWSNQGGSSGAVYYIAIGSAHAELLQTTKRFVFLMQPHRHSVTVIEAPRAAGPFTAYRFTPVAS